MKRQPFLSVQKLHSLLGINPASIEVPTLANVDMPIYRALILANARIPIHVSVEAPHLYLHEAPSLPYRLIISFFQDNHTHSCPWGHSQPNHCRCFRSNRCRSTHSCERHSRQYRSDLLLTPTRTQFRCLFFQAALPFF